VVTRLCSVPRCGRYRTIGTHCATHAAEYQGKDNKRRYAKRLAHGRQSQHWVALRRQKLAIAPLCEFRYPGCTSRATTVHLDPRLQGDHLKARLEDCASACHHCHGVVDGARSAA
jgi:hypothetical protein